MRNGCNYIFLRAFICQLQGYVLDLTKIFNEINETTKRGNEIVNI